MKAEQVTQFKLKLASRFLRLIEKEGFKFRQNMAFSNIHIYESRYRTIIVKTRSITINGARLHLLQSVMYYDDRGRVHSFINEYLQRF